MEKYEFHSYRIFTRNYLLPYSLEPVEFTYSMCNNCFNDCFILNPMRSKEREPLGEGCDNRQDEMIWWNNYKLGNPHRREPVVYEDYTYCSLMHVGGYSERLFFHLKE
jgi:hypothetical protein